jgi:hypothetical protein
MIRAYKIIFCANFVYGLEIILFWRYEVLPQSSSLLYIGVFGTLCGVYVTICYRRYVTFALRFVTIHTVLQMATICNNPGPYHFLVVMGGKENIKSCRLLQLLYMRVSILHFHAFFWPSINISFCLSSFSYFLYKQNDILRDRQIKTTFMSHILTHRYSNERNLQKYTFFPPVIMGNRCSPGVVCNNCYIPLPFAERYVTTL